MRRRRKQLCGARRRRTGSWHSRWADGACGASRPSTSTRGSRAGIWSFHDDWGKSSCPVMTTIHHVEPWLWEDDGEEEEEGESKDWRAILTDPSRDSSGQGFADAGRRKISGASSTDSTRSLLAGSPSRLAPRNSRILGTTTTSSDPAAAMRAPSSWIFVAYEPLEPDGSGRHASRDVPRRGDGFGTRPAVLQRGRTPPCTRGPCADGLAGPPQ